MPGPRKLWTGPCGMSPLDRAIDRASSEPSGLWLVPSRLAREQVIRALAGRSKSVEPPRVWCWSDAWKAIAGAQGDVPARLSPSGLMAVLAEAIESTRRLGSIEALSNILDLPGYRRQLARRFAGWTRDERPSEGPPPGESAVDQEEWAVYRTYRAVLRQVGAEDPEGWDVWASTMLAKQPPPELRKPGPVVVIDPISPARAGWRLLDYCHQRAKSMTVTLPFDADPNLAELYACVDDTRRQFLGWGFVEETERLDGLALRPAGLVAGVVPLGCSRAPADQTGNRPGFEDPGRAEGRRGRPPDRPRGPRLARSRGPPRRDSHPRAPDG
jgi:hypothetical protein